MRNLILALLMLGVASAQTTPPPTPTPSPPIVCGPGQITNPPGVLPPCYTPLPPEWTPRVAFYIQTMPQGGGSVPDPHTLTTPKPGEVFITVPILWDLYQSQAAANGNLPYYAVHGGMRGGDSYLAHFANGPCFVMIRHQTPPPDRTVIFSLATNGDSSVGGGAGSINGTKAACATPQGGTVGHYTGDVTIQLF